MSCNAQLSITLVRNIGRAQVKHWLVIKPIKQSLFDFKDHKHTPGCSAYLSQPHSSANKVQSFRKIFKAQRWHGIFWGLIFGPGIFLGFDFFLPFDHPHQLKSGVPPPTPLGHTQPNPDNPNASPTSTPLQDH